MFFDYFVIKVTRSLLLILLCSESTGGQVDPSETEIDIETEKKMFKSAESEYTILHGLSNYLNPDTHDIAGSDPHPEKRDADDSRRRSSMGSNASQSCSRSALSASRDCTISNSKWYCTCSSLNSKESSQFLQLCSIKFSSVSPRNASRNLHRHPKLCFELHLGNEYMQ